MLLTDGVMGWKSLNRHTAKILTAYVVSIITTQAFFFITQLKRVRCLHSGSWMLHAVKCCLIVFNFILFFFIFIYLFFFFFWGGGGGIWLTRGGGYAEWDVLMLSVATGLIAPFSCGCQIVKLQLVWLSNCFCLDYDGLCLNTIAQNHKEGTHSMEWRIIHCRMERVMTKTMMVIVMIMMLVIDGDGHRRWKWWS